MRVIVFLYLLLFSCNLSSKGVQHLFFNDVRCIAATLKHETSFADMRNSRAVYDVIRTRMKQTGKDACTVVLSPRQFSGMTKRKVVEVSKKDLQLYWEVCKMRPVCPNCSHFHATYIGKPEWAKGNRVALRADKHVFYKLKERV